MNIFFAHSLEGRHTDEWHQLDEHLKGTVSKMGNIFHADNIQ